MVIILKDKNYFICPHLNSLVLCIKLLLLTIPVINHTLILIKNMQNLLIHIYMEQCMRGNLYANNDIDQELL